MSMSLPEKLAVALALSERWAGAMPGASLTDRIAGVTDLGQEGAKGAAACAESLIGAMGFASIQLASSWLKDVAEAPGWAPSSPLVEWAAAVAPKLGSAGTSAQLAQQLQALARDTGGTSTPADQVVAVETPHVEVAERTVPAGPGAEPPMLVTPNDEETDPLGVAEASDELESLPFDEGATEDSSGPAFEPLISSLDDLFDDDDSVDLDGPSDDDDE
jgi:hypothetical protein